MLIDGKSFLDVPVKNKEEAYEKKLWVLVKIMITQLVIYWTMNTSQNITNCNRFKQTNWIWKSWFKARN